MKFLMVRPDYVEANPKDRHGVARAISRGGALFRSKPEDAKAALAQHRLSRINWPTRSSSSHTHGRRRHAAWGTMSAAGWQKVINFATGAESSKICPKRRRIKRACSGRIDTSASRSLARVRIPD
jgi:hypothetical protein